MMKNKQYPQQTGPYVVKVKSEQSTHNWQNFNTARLQISVGQDYHEGEKLQAAINWCKSRFDNVQICVNDTLQRRNKMFELNINEKEAFNITKREGQEWIDRNLHLFSAISNLEMRRWDSWEQEDNYFKAQQQIRWMYSNNIDFKNGIDSNINDIWKRRVSKTDPTYNENRYDEFFELSKEYLLEEISIFSIMFEKDNAIDIYPGTFIAAGLIFQNTHPEGAPSGLGKGKFCRIDFSKNKNYPSLKLLA